MSGLTNRYAFRGAPKAELLAPADTCQFLLDSLTQSLLFVSDLFDYRSSRQLLHIWDDTQLDPDGPVESGSWKGSHNMVIDLSGKVPSTRKDIEWYALWMTHEYVHFVQGNVASALRAGEMPPIRHVLTMQYGQDFGWSSPLSSFLLYRLPASLLGFVDKALGRETLVELFRTAPDVPSARMGGQADPSAVCSWFQQYTGVPPGQLEADWHTFLASVETDERHVGAIKLLRATEEIGMDSLLAQLRRTGRKLDSEFAQAFDGLMDDIQRYGRRFGAPDWRGEMLRGSHEELTLESLGARIARMAEWADELKKGSCEL